MLFEDTRACAVKSPMIINQCKITMSKIAIVVPTNYEDTDRKQRPKAFLSLRHIVALSHDTPTNYFAA